MIIRPDMQTWDCTSSELGLLAAYLSAAVHTAPVFRCCSCAHQVWHHCEQSITVHDLSVNLIDVVQLYQNKEKVAEHIAAEGSKDAVAKVICVSTTLVL